MLTKFFADSVTKPGKSPVLKNPGEFGLDYEDVEFKAADGVVLSGWLVKGGTDRVIILSHFGAQCSRSGYTPKGKGLIKAYNKEIEYLNTVKHLVKDGSSVLMYDFRNHGNSGAGTCPWITGGVEEHKDVIAAVNFITNHEVYQDSHIGLLSMCMGANSTTYAYGVEGGLQEFPNIMAFISIQPLKLSDFFKGFGLSKKMTKKANALNLERGGKDFYQSCNPNAAKINVPTLLVQAKGDPWTDFDQVQEYYDSLNVEKEMYWIEGTKKRLESYDWFRHSPDVMLDFFNKYC